MITTDVESNIERVSNAFSAQAGHFDADEESNRILKWMRSQVYRHEEEFLLPQSDILELNAGTGIDALHFARLGHSVFAIDNAPGMVNQLKNKISDFHFENRIRCDACSMTQLDKLPEEQFDHVFSNFGGLNCIPDVHEVARQLPRLLRPGATVTMVLMPHVCLWEILQVFRGKFRLAARRFSRNGTPAQIDGHTFTSFYYSPLQVIKAFDDRFAFARLRGLATFSPPPYYDSFPGKYPRMYGFLLGLDERFSTLPPFNRWGDHFILTMKYLP